MKVSDRFWAWAHWLHSSQNSDAPRVSSPVQMTYLWLTGKVHGWRVRRSSVPIAWARALWSPWFPSGHHASLDTIMSYVDDSSSLRAHPQILALAPSSPLSLLQLWWSWSTEIVLLFSFSNPKAAPYCIQDKNPNSWACAQDDHYFTCCPGQCHLTWSQELTRVLGLFSQ